MGGGNRISVYHAVLVTAVSAAFFVFANPASAAQLQSINFVPQASYPSCARGTFFYSSSTDQFMLCTTAGGQPSPIVTGASNVWTLSGSNLYPMNTSYNVGIGTTNPAKKLEVNGVQDFNGLGISGSYAPGTTTPLSGTAGFPGITRGVLLTDSTDFSLWTQREYGGDHTEGVIAFGDDSNSGLSFEYWPWNGTGTNPPVSVMYMNPSGNVGIGTMAPTTAGLVVTKNISSIGIDVSNNRIQNVGTPVNAADATTKSYVDSIVAVATSSQYWILSGSNLYPNSTGYNVGIGTTAPGAAKLAVVGNVNVGTGPGDTTQRIVNVYGNGSTPGQVALWGAATDQFLKITGKGGGASIPAQIESNYGLELTYGEHAQENGFRINQTTSTNTVFQILGGYVGINTTSPGTNLDVNGNVNASVYYDRDNASYYLDPAGNVMPYAANLKGLVNIPLAVSGVAYGLQAGGSYALTFQGNQDCAANAFLFQNAYSIKGDCSGNAQAFKWETSHASFGSRGIGFSYGTGSGNGIIFYADSVATVQDTVFTPTARMIINDAGNVGIGTTNPGATLHLYTTGTATNFFRMTAAGYSPDIDFGFYEDSGGFYIKDFASSTAPVQIYPGNPSQALVLRNGNVGVGATAPKGKFDVLGNYVVDSKTIGISSTWTPVLSINMPGDHTSAYAKIFYGGSDWSCHSAVRFEAEFDIIDGNGGYGEPGNIIFQHSNTASDQIQARLTHIDPNTINIELRTYDIEGNGFTCNASSTSGRLAYEVSGNFSSVGLTTGTITTSNATPQIFNQRGGIGIGTASPTTAGLVVSTNVSSIGIDVSNNRIQNVGTPVNAADATTKSYVDSIVAVATSSQYWILSGSNLYPDSMGYKLSVGATNPPDGDEAAFIFSNTTGNVTINETDVNFRNTGLKAYAVSPGSSGTYTIPAISSYRTIGLMGVAVQGSAPNGYVPFGVVGVGISVNSSPATGGLFEATNVSGGDAYGVKISNVTSATGIPYAIYSNTAARSYFAGNVGINTTSPGTNLDVNGNTNASIYYDRDNVNYYVNPAGNVLPYALNTGGGINIGGGGTFSGSLAVNGANVTLSNATQLILNSTSSSAIQMNQGSITGVYKLSVAVVDPLYNIGGINYSTYAPSIAGGVKEEFVGNAKLQMTNDKYYEYVIDFDGVAKGSDLWVWRKAVDFGPDTVQAFVTPIGVPVPIAYTIEGNKIIFTTSIQNTEYQIPNTGIAFSYRLVGSRFDWREWPTFSKDQTEKTSLTIQ